MGSENQTILNCTLPEIQAINYFVRKISEVCLNDKKKSLINRMMMLNMLARSLAPSIYGNEVAKRALILQLVGGVRKKFENGINLRGDINILLIGDPGLGKSHLLRIIMNLFPNFIATT